MLDSTSGDLTLGLAGRLNAKTTAPLWREASRLVEEKGPKTLRLDASQVTYCDGSGIALFIELEKHQQRRGAKFQLIGLSPQIQQLYDLYTKLKVPQPSGPPAKPLHGVEKIGHAIVEFLGELYEQIAFTGRLTSNLFQALLHPKKNIRWKDVWLIFDTGGVQALSIVLLLTFLVGAITAFQAAIPMRRFGADIYVANLVVLSIFRELGPLITAIILVGRSGSAFAAELGTMKVNEEIDALQTMGLDPVKFLVTNRVLAVVFFTPLLTAFGDLAGLMGGSVVFTSFGYPLITYFHQVQGAAQISDFMSGIIKAFAFGFLIAAIGCQRGLETTFGASAVGRSATRAIVTGLVLIIIVDGVFSAVYYYIGF